MGKRNSETCRIQRPPAPPTIAQCVAMHVRCDPAALRLEPIATGKFNTSYYATDGLRQYVIRIAPPDNTPFLFYERRMMAQEPAIHDLLLDQTTVPAPQILVYDAGRAVIDRDYLIMERLPGTPMSESAGLDADKALYQVGQCLARTHRLTAGQYGYLGAHRPMEPASSWIEAFSVMWEKLLADVAGTGHYSQSEVRMLMKLLDRNLSAFQRPVTSCLLHMDVWAQNILVDADGNVTGLLDWDRSLRGDVEIEFAVLDYCGISQPAFWEGYGAARDESAEAKVRHRFYWLYELQKYIVIRHGRGRDPSAAARYKRAVMRCVETEFGA